MKNPIMKMNNISITPDWKRIAFAASVLVSSACGSIELDNKIPVPGRKDGPAVMDARRSESETRDFTVKSDKSDGITKDGRMSDYKAKDSKPSDSAAKDKAPLKSDALVHDAGRLDSGKPDLAKDSSLGKDSSHKDAAKADYQAKQDSKSGSDSKPHDSKPADSAKPDGKHGPDALILDVGTKCLQAGTGSFSGYVDKVLPVVVGGFGFLYKGFNSHDGGPKSARYSIDCGYQAVTPSVDCPLGAETVIIVPQDGRTITIKPTQIGAGATIASIKVEKS